VVIKKDDLQVAVTWAFAELRSARMGRKNMLRDFRMDVVK
jgi:hypothetical protein